MKNGLIDIIEMPDDEYTPFDIPCCPMCGNPMDLGEPVAIGSLSTGFGKTLCLIHRDCIDEEE